MTRLELARRHAVLQERVDRLRAALEQIAVGEKTPNGGFRELGRLGMAHKAQAALERDETILAWPMPETPDPGRRGAW